MAYCDDPGLADYGLAEWLGAAPDAALVELDREIVRRGGLRAFIELAWPTVEGGNPYSSNWHIDAVADHLEAVSRGEITRLMIAVPPRSAKSIVTAVMFPAWDWIEHPERRTLYASYAHNLSIRDSARCRRVIQSPWFQARWGDRFAITSDQNAKWKFENDKTGYRLATSVGGQLTGEGGSIVVVDDPLNSTDSNSEAKRESMLSWWAESMSTRLNDPRTGAYVIIQQRLHERDLIGDILRKHGTVQAGGDYTYLCIPAEYEPDHPHKWVRDPRKELGQLMWPEHIPRKTIEDLKRSLGPYACNPFEAPVLMADLSSKPIGEVRAGDQVVGFGFKEAYADGVKPRQMLKVAQVKSVFSSVKPVVRMTLDSGRAIRCTADHKWFTKWRGPLRPAYLPASVGSRLARICDPELPVLNREDERLAGWLAGFFDGEGSVSACRKASQPNFRSSNQISFYQTAERNLPLCEKLEHALRRLGFEFAIFDKQRNKANWQLARQYHLLNGGLPMYQRFLHVVQPTKWRDRLIAGAFGAKFIQQRERVVSIEPDGEEMTFALETDTGNYVVWGLASSNSAGQLQQRPAPREGGIFKAGWFPVVQSVPADLEYARGWDLAATEAKLVKSDPDWTACVQIGWSRSAKRWFITDVKRWRENPSEIERLILLTARHDPVATKIVLPKDPGQAGVAQSRNLLALLAGFDVQAEPQSGDKMTRAMPLAGQAGGGNVALLAGPWNDAFLQEITGFPTGAHDDQVDAAASAFTRLTGGTSGIMEFYARQADDAAAKRAAHQALLDAHGGTLPGTIVTEEHTQDLGRALLAGLR